MDEEAGSKGARTRICGRCGALNGKQFDRCVRCGGALSTMTRSLERLGGRLDADGLWATKILIGATVLVFAAQIWVAQLRDGRGPIDALLRPSNVDAIRFGALHVALLLDEPWRLASAVFVHFGALHLVGNMFFLAWLGRIAEPAVGSARFVSTYVTAGILGFVASAAYTVFVDSGGGGVTAGASGAVFGIMGLVLGMLYRQKNPQWKRFALQAVLFNVLLGLSINQARVGVMINNIAHLGGLACGVGWGLLFATPARAAAARRSDLWANLGAALGLFACLASLVLSQRSPTWKELERLGRRSSGGLSVSAPEYFPPPQ